MIGACIRIFARVVTRRILAEGISFEEAVSVYPKLKDEDIAKIKVEVDKRLNKEILDF